MEKQLCALFLLFISLFNLAAQETQQLYDFSYGDLYYKKTSENTVEVSPISKISTTESVIYNSIPCSFILEIPTQVCDEYDNWYVVTGIGAHAFEGSDVGYLNYSDSIRYIGECAFKSCKQLIHAKISPLVNEISKSAFENCTRLQHVFLGKFGFIPLDEIDKINPDVSITIEIDAFKETPSLTKVFIGRELSIDLPGGKYNHAFSNAGYHYNSIIFFVQNPDDSKYENLNLNLNLNLNSYGSFDELCAFPYGGSVNIHNCHFNTNIPNGTVTQLTELIPINNYNCGSYRNLINVEFTIQEDGVFNPTCSLVYPLDYSIYPIPLTIKVDDTQREYGEANPEFNISVTGYINNDEGIYDERPTILNGTIYTDYPMPDEKSPVGEYPIVSKILDSYNIENYYIEEKYGTMTITPANLEISCGTYTREYGKENPIVDLSYSGFKNNETTAEFTVRPTINIEADTYSDVGEYPISIGYAEAQNYIIKYNFGKLIITKGTQSIDWIQNISQVRIGDTLELNAVSSSGLPIEYISSNPKIAEVNGSVVKFISEGHVILSAYQAGNNNYKSVVMEKEVEVSPVLINKLTLNVTDLKMNIGETYKLIAQIEPDNATDKTLNWQSTNPNVVAVSEDGIVTAIGTGNAEINVTANDASATMASCLVSVENPSGINDIYNTEIHIYSQNGQLIIEGINQEENIEIFDLIGRRIYIGTERIISLNHGVYIIKTPLITQKILIQ